jgi:hypothetical protein
MIHLLGIDHWLQEYELCSEHELAWDGCKTERERTYRRNGKERFYAIVEDLLRSGCFHLLGEECSADQDTIARDLCVE